MGAGWDGGSVSLCEWERAKGYIPVFPSPNPYVCPPLNLPCGVRLLIRAAMT